MRRVQVLGVKVEGLGFRCLRLEFTGFYSRIACSDVSCVCAVRDSRCKRLAPQSPPSAQGLHLQDHGTQ